MSVANALAFLRRDKWGWAALLAVGAVFTRATGILLVIPFGLAWLGFAVYLAWQIAVWFVLPMGNMDLAVFYRAGREAAAGNDPYLFRGEMVFLSPPPALGVFRLVSALPYPAVAIPSP